MTLVLPELCKGRYRRCDDIVKWKRIMISLLTSLAIILGVMIAVGYCMIIRSLRTVVLKYGYRMGT